MGPRDRSDEPLLTFDRARGVAARRAGIVGHVGEYHNGALIGPGNVTLGPDTGPNASAGYAEFLSPSGQSTSGFTSYFRFAFARNCTQSPCAVGAASLAAISFDQGSGGFWSVDNSVAYVAGWYNGDIAIYDGGYPFGFQPQDLQTTGQVRDVLVASLLGAGSNAGYYWVRTFTGAGSNEALSVSAGPPCGDLYFPYKDLCTTNQDLLAVAGFFNGTMELKQGTQISTASANSGGFVAIMDKWSGGIHGSLALSSSLGAVRINAVAMDRNQNVYIAGSFATASLDFDPDGSSPFTISSPFNGAGDIFVAHYILDATTTPYTLQLNWVYTTGSAGSDAATALAIGADGALRVCAGPPDVYIRRSSWQSTGMSLHQPSRHLDCPLRYQSTDAASL